MTGSDHQLLVYLGAEVVAELALVNDELHWKYRPDWQHKGFAISPHLPLTGAVPPLNVQRFVRNLLPEGDSLDALLHNFRLSKNNTFGLIRALGADTSGALALLGAGQPWPSSAHFRPLATGELEARLDQGDARQLLFWDGKPRLSLAGVQGKLNVLVQADGQIGFGEGLLCSTHLLKFERQQQSHLVLNEQFSMQLARACGLPVANTRMLRFGNHPALLVERFDRRLLADGAVQRRHVIDGCQALNLPPEYKYERNFGSGRDVRHIRDGASLPQLFAFTRSCANPALARQTLLDWVLFNLLLCNHDAHGKNISFFVGPQGMAITPFYDLVNTAMYPEFEQEMAMALGDAFASDAIHAYQLADFADSCDLPRALLANRCQRLAGLLAQALEKQQPPLPLDHSEQQYLGHYRHLLHQRCAHFLTQAAMIRTVAL